MLSRTADSLFWIGRYVERAGGVARGLTAALRMASLRPPEQEAEEWGIMLRASGTAEAYARLYGKPEAARVVDWLTVDTLNPSSIASCLGAARRNGRAVRTALTVDMWEAVNDTWIELQRLDPATVRGDRLPLFLDWVKSRTLAFNGAVADTMLRDDAWRFTHLGTMLERADNTARVLNSRHEAFASAHPADHVHWQTILRSLSALRAYQYTYRARLEPARVVELILLRPEMPRSLRFCYDRVNRTLAEIDAREAHPCSGCRVTATQLLARCDGPSVEDLMARGLQDFLSDAVAENGRLGSDIARCFLNG